MRVLQPFRALREKTFARLYFAETISLLGDAFTWVGIALLAFEFGPDQSAKILSIALTLRVSAYILFGPYAGVLADRLDRKTILWVSHFARMAVVAMLPFVHEIWQIYGLIFLLNVFNAFFTPAYKAAIPQVIARKENFADAITLSSATWQLLGILGPGLAGIMAVFLGARQIFFFDAVSFVLAGLLILTIPGNLRLPPEAGAPATDSIWADIMDGTKRLFQKRPIRFALFIELAAAIAGAQILVNTIGHIKGDFHLTDKYYGWVMTAFGIGATVAAFSAAILDKSKNKRVLLIGGAALLSGAILAGNFVPYWALLLLWLLAGIGQSFTEMPSQILIAENIELPEQGKVYGAHFAWSHLWWAIGYPIAGLTGTYFKADSFLIGGLITVGLLILVGGFFRRGKV